MLTSLLLLTACGDDSPADTGEKGCAGKWAGLSTDVLSPRIGASAAFGGSELFVWGGAPIPSGAELADGARYDTASKAWQALPATGAGRTDAFTGASGSSLVVLGGTAAGATLTDGFVLDVAAGTSAPIPLPAEMATASGVSYELTKLSGDTLFTAVVAPTSLAYWCSYSLSGASWSCEDALEYFKKGPLGGWQQDFGPDGWTVWGGNELISWGSTTAPSNAGVRYDIQTKHWSVMSTTDAPEPRDQPLVAWVGDRLLVGGGTAGGAPLSSGGLYDPKSDTWTAMTPIPDVSWWGSVARAGEQLVFWSDAAGKGGVYDLSSSTWMPLCLKNAMPAANPGATHTWTGSQLLVVGGAQSSQRIGAVLSL
ncbi:MAG: hypothetical protein KC776_25895 [Myxococcales bacterium]|nr:hypothetical protein [Myxococcales bacterium]MCB9580777.1 hypothetical protein [Polyangiaceae bacterium]